jgi:flagellar hook-associated protein 2
MATISSLGVGSGLDSEGIIAALMNVERLPLNQLTQQATDYKTKLSSIGQLQSLTATMRDKASAISGISLWNQKTFTSGNTAVVNGSVSSSGAAGHYSVTVSALAAGQTVTSSALPSSASELSSGSLQIELGTWTGASFSAQSTKSITIADDATSLADIRDAINSADAGVTASIVNDANGARLSIRSSETGEENGFRITATETTDDGDTATGLSALGYDAAVAGTPMTLNQASANAVATINGIAVESTTNTLADVSDGLTLTLSSLSATPVEVTVGDDTEAIRTAINDFVSAFNSLAAYIKDQTKYNAATKTGAPLQGDRTTIGYQWQLRGVINQGSTASSTWSRLSEVGIEMKADGSLGVTTSKLDDALAKPDELRKLLATDGTDAAGSGFMDRFKDLGSSVLDLDGSLETLQTSLEDRIKDNEKRQDAVNDRLTQTEARLRAQYQALDTTMARMNALSSYVNQQMAMLMANS